jgi:hypothetical protein
VSEQPPISELPRVTGEAYTRHPFRMDSCPTDEPHRIEDCTVEVAPSGVTPTRAERIHDGRGAVCEIEDELDDWWEGVDRTTTDVYDNSLEIYFEPHVEDLEPTPEQVAAILSWGFSRFWLNFKGGQRDGGTERRYVKPAEVPSESDAVEDSDV